MLTSQDLAWLSRQGGSDSVHLRLHFKRGLHPFFPPRVELMAPRFLGPVLGALCSHPLLQLAFWDPWMRQQEMLELLKAFLQVCPSPSLGRCMLEHAVACSCCPRESGHSAPCSRHCLQIASRAADAQQPQRCQSNADF